MRYYLALTYSGLDINEFPGLFAAPADPDPKRVLELLLPATKNLRFMKSKPGTGLLVADAYRQLGRFDDALALLRGSPSSLEKAAGWQLLGLAYEGKDNFAAAHYCFDRAFRLAETEIVPLKKKTLLARKAGKTLEALRQIQRILELNPADEWAQSFLKSYAGENKEAARFCRLLDSKF